MISYQSLLLSTIVLNDSMHMYNNIDHEWLTQTNIPADHIRLRTNSKGKNCSMFSTNGLRV